jgi:hypothetical protein
MTTIRRGECNFTAASRFRDVMAMIDELAYN